MSCTKLLALGWLIFVSAGFAMAETPGQVVLRQVPHGQYQRYLPRKSPLGILVVAHGTPEPTENVPELAEKFLNRWSKFAETHRLLTIAPAFDNDYGGVEETPPGVPAGGYRGLFGKQVGADEFLHEIVDQEGALIQDFDGRIYLYGHSAGGQFVGRYCVRHPDRVKGAVLSAAGRFAYPNPEAPWPYGMGKSQIMANMNGNLVAVEPDPVGWTKAAGLPITIVIGSADTDPQPERPAHSGKTRIDFSKGWVEAMNRLTTPPGRIQLVQVNRVGHDSAKLTPKCQERLAAMMKQK